MQIQSKCCNRAIIPTIMLMFIVFTTPIVTSRAGSGEIIIEGTQHYVFVLGVLEEGTPVSWTITTDEGNINLYIAEIAQYEKYADGMAWLPVYENMSRSTHEHQFEIPLLTNWTIVLENPNQADVQVTYDINVPITIPGLLAIPTLLGFVMILIVRKKRTNKRNS